MKIIETARSLLAENAFKNKVREYLLQSARDRGAPWRDKKALEITIDDIMDMDADLKEYVHEYLCGNGKAETTIECDIASIDELITSKVFSPVNAALFIQWYRHEPQRAAAFLMQHDVVCGIPDMVDDSES